MKKTSVVFLLLSFLGSLNLARAGEFALVNQTVTWTESSGGFYLWWDTNKGPTNWVSPLNYYNGQVYVRLEILAQPTTQTCYLSFCFWGRAAPGQPSDHQPETCSPISDVLQGAGSVVTFNSSPSTWWRHDVYGGVDFSNRTNFLNWGLPLWVSKSPGILLGLSPEHWAQRAKWLPMTLKATVVAVSQGSTFSGWTNYIASADTQAPTTPTNLAVATVTSTSISLSWSPAIDNVAVAGYRIYRNGVQAGTSTTSNYTDVGLVPSTAYGYTVRAFDAAGNQSTNSAAVNGVTSRAGTGGTVPTQGLGFWVRPDAGLTLNGSSVSQWADQSGNSRHASQTTPTNQPTFVPNALNGMPALRFDGTNDFLNFSMPINDCTGLTLVVVAANSASRDPGINHGDYAPLFWEETAWWGWTYLSPFQTNIVMRFGTTQSANLFKYTRPGSIGNSYSVTTGVHNGTNDSLYVNGSRLMSAGGKLAPIAAAVDTPFLGRGASSTYFPGDLAEVLVYTRALSDSERVELENYLRARYFPAQLPTTQISSPTNGASFFAPTNIPILATASSTNGTISRVEFYAGETLIGQITNPPFNLTWSNVAAGSYEFTARAVDNIGAASFSSPVSVVVSSPPVAPAAPTDLSARALSGDRINLFWTDNATNETGFRIESKVGPGGTYAPVAAAGANVTNYSHTGLEGGAQYYYRVYATNSAGDSPASNEAEATTRPPLLPPVIAAVANQSLVAGATWCLTNQAHDPNTPPLRLRFSLPAAPAGAAIDATNGLVTWRPPFAQSGSSNLFRVVVCQEGGWETNLAPVADAHVIESYPNANYGAQASLMVKLSSTPGLTRESFLRFDLTGIAGAVSEATLRLTPTVASLPSTHVLALVPNNAWGETTLNWANKPPSTGLLATWTPQAGVPVQVPLAGAAENALLGDGLLSLRVRATNSTADGLVYYGAKEGSAANAPQLFVASSAGPALSATQSFWVTVNAPVHPTLSLPGRDSNGQFMLVISGDPGLDYTIQASTNLLDWSALFTTNGPSLPFQFLDPAASNHPVRFYRVLLSP